MRFSNLSAVLCVLFSSTAYSAPIFLDRQSQSEDGPQAAFEESLPPAHDRSGVIPGVVNALFIRLSEEHRQEAAREAAYEREMTAVHTRIAEFLSNYHEISTLEPQKLRRFYAHYVDYGSRGVVSRAVVLREQARLRRSCPVRRYYVEYEDVAIRKASRPNTYDVHFQVERVCLGGPKETRRILDNYITVRFAGEDAEIVAASGQLR
jgi:hypothetical protein